LGGLADSLPLTRRLAELWPDRRSERRRLCHRLSGEAARGSRVGRGHSAHLPRL